MASYIRRRKFLAMLSGAVAAWPLAARAQQAGKVYRIGYLGSGLPAFWATRVEALRTGLRGLGYVEGKNIVIEFRWAERVDRLPDLVAELVRMNVDVIFAPSSTEVEPARQATKTIPIVFATHADPVGIGHVASLPRPDGNITGLAMLLTDLAAKELEILKEAVPQGARLAELALKYRLTSMFGQKEPVEAGGLMSYAADLNDLTRRAAVYIDKILKGAKPADLPVEQASKYELVINLKTAKAIGLTMSEAFLLRADKVIE
jgi:ABC-type uncharacterized transport system substrate-binding protein